MNNTTKAFNHLVDNEFISKFQNFSKHNIKPNGSFLDEITLQNAMCRFYSYELLTLMPNWNEAKHKYRKSIANLSPELSWKEYNNSLDTYKDNFKTLAKLKYTLEDIIKGNYEINILNYLFALYRGFKKIPMKEFKYSNEYIYISQASAENDINLEAILKLGYQDLVKSLYKSVALTKHYQNYGGFAQTLGINDNDEPEAIYYELPEITLDENSSCDDTYVLSKAEKQFEQRLNKDLNIIMIDDYHIF